ncbi:hypothetical protein quinque_006107 [Culex quinquefasciatus]
MAISDGWPAFGSIIAIVCTCVPRVRKTTKYEQGFFGNTNTENWVPACTFTRSCGIVVGVPSFFLRWRGRRKDGEVLTPQTAAVAVSHRNEPVHTPNANQRGYGENHI